jgi:hypothetical protein
LLSRPLNTKSIFGATEPVKKSSCFGFGNPVG